MDEWEVWRQDDNGNKVRVAGYNDRVEAVARVLVFETGPRHRQTYWIQGPAGPGCRTNLELYQRVRRVGAELEASDRPLSEYLRSLWSVGTTLRDHTQIELDLFIGMLVAAARLDPPPPDPAWHTANLGSDDFDGYQLWERIIRSQVADLEEMPHSRPEGSGRRATDRRWASVVPSRYLVSGLTGTFGGDPEPDEPPFEALMWDDLAEFALCGQSYE